MDDLEFVKLSVGDVFHRRYRIDRLIKTGGFGAVYEVFDQNTDGRRALKVMLQNAFEDPELHERFMREVKIAGSIESDHIVRVYDAGTDEATRTPFMVMELLEGEELAVLAKRQAKLQRPLPWSEILDYLAQTARALDKVHAHPRKIVHRDLKPQNLFVTRRENGEACIKVLDFGIAKIDTADKTSTRGLGTPKYMAPEQIRGQSRRIGPATDTLALAQIAYTLLAGEAYWTEEEKNAESPFFLYLIIAAGVVEPPVARARRRSDVALPPAFDAWFLKGTAEEPEQRFAKATECIAALAEVLSIPHRPTMRSELTLDPLPPPPEPKPREPDGTTAPPLPSGFQAQGMPPPSPVGTDTGQSAPSGDHSTRPTGDTKQGLTKDALLQVPARSWRPALGGGLAVAGVVVAGLVGKAVWPSPTEQSGPRGLVLSATPPSVVPPPSSPPEPTAPPPPTSPLPAPPATTVVLPTATPTLMQGPKKGPPNRPDAGKSPPPPPPTGTAVSAPPQPSTPPVDPNKPGITGTKI